MLSQLSNKTVLITGASGFIGSYLVKEILTLNLCRVKLRLEMKRTISIMLIFY